MIEQNLNLNTYPSKYTENQKYQKHRFELLKEFVCETVDDEEYSARRIYEEFLSAINEEIEWREKGYLKAKELRNIVLNNNPYGLTDYFTDSDTDSITLC